MELDNLISEICKRVQDRLDALEQPDGACDDKPRLLLIAQDHGEICHPTLESDELAEYYHVDCMLLEEKLLDVAKYEGVIAYTLTNEALGKIANGIFDTDYTKAFGKALLLGKKIFLPEEEVELYSYRDTAPAGYYARLEENLKFLENNGVTIVKNSELIPAILGKKETVRAERCEAPARPEKAIHLTKKVITERDLISARDENVTCVTFSAKAILTDLAKDYGKRHNIRLERQHA